MEVGSQQRQRDDRPGKALQRFLRIGTDVRLTDGRSIPPEWEIGKPSLSGNDHFLLVLNLFSQKNRRYNIFGERD